MGIIRLLTYTALPAAAGAAASLGYDGIDAAEGARQAVVAGLPLAALSGSTSGDEGKSLMRTFARNPIMMTGLSVVATAAFYYGGSHVMEMLTPDNLDHGFTAAAGAVEGGLVGMLVSYVARKRY